MLLYQASLPLSSATLNLVAGIIRRHRLEIGSRWRRLNPGQQALLTLAWLHKGRYICCVGVRVWGLDIDGGSPR